MAEKVKYYGTGRRKSSVARVYVMPGKGKIVINGKDVKDYLPFETCILDLKQPLALLGAEDRYDVIAEVKGGGFNGQAEAIRLGLARALLEANEDRTVLKKAGMLTRNARSKERKKYGLKAARRAPQFSKR